MKSAVGITNLIHLASDFCRDMSLEKTALCLIHSLVRLTKH